MDYIKVNGLQKDEVIGLVKEWIKLYPHSFNPDVTFGICELADNQVIIGLHDDLSTLAVSLLVIYLTSALKETTSADAVAAYLTVDDNEILLKQNYGRRAKIFAKSTEEDKTSVYILLENDYCVEYSFKGHAKPVKDSGMAFEEPQIGQLDEAGKCEFAVGDVLPKHKIDKSLEPDASPLQKLMWYLVFGAVGLGIGFLLVYIYF